MNLWLKDPKNGHRSVSLTLLVISVTLMVIFIVLEAFDTLQSTSLLDEFFYASLSLYFGRRFSFQRSGGSEIVEKSAEVEEAKYGHPVTED